MFVGEDQNNLKSGLTATTSQLAFNCSKSTTATLLKRCKICSKLTINIPERRR